MAVLNPFKKFAALRAYACRVGTLADTKSHYTTSVHAAQEAVA